MKLALELHPDKQPGTVTEDALEAVKTKFHQMIEAHQILSEPGDSVIGFIGLGLGL